MTHVIENESLKVTVDDHGAELVSVYDKTRGCERIWCADPNIWNRHAPILFPFVGQVAGKKYRHNGHEYEMTTQHGFARDREFTYAAPTQMSSSKCSAEDNQIVHRLVSDEASLAIYPFPFELDVTHHFLGTDDSQSRTLVVEWSLKNSGTEDMYYSIGGHPGFAIPTESGIDRSQCYLQFPSSDDTNSDKELTYILINANGNAITDKAYTLDLDNDGFCQITPDFFDKDALIFENGQIDCVRLALPDKSPYVTLFCKDFPYVGIWSKPVGQFVCLEPWIGRTDDADFGGELQEKTGERMLKVGETVEYSYAMQFH